MKNSFDYSLERKKKFQVQHENERLLLNGLENEEKNKQINR